MTTVRKILIIKTSSLGDVVHMLPAISDACRPQPGLMIDWVVEENFAEVPRWHPAIRNIIPVALRRWRKHLFSPTNLARNSPVSRPVATGTLRCRH